jgi:hypothetical protein
MIKTRDDIVREELEKTILQSALMKEEAGEILHLDQVNQQIVEFLARYDWVWCFWREPRNQSGLGASIVRDLRGEEKSSWRCQSLMCADRETALKMHGLCGGPDNRAPEFPPEPAAP